MSGTGPADVEMKLALARAGNDPDQLATALVERAALLLVRGGLRESLADLHEAREIYEASARPAEQARCLHTSATVYRLLGELDDAEAHARRAEGLADAATPSRVAAILEQGEVALARGNDAAAAEWFARALAEGRMAGLLENEQARLLRKLGVILASAGRWDEAASALVEACELHRASGAADESRRAAVELATLHEQAGHAEAADTLIARTLAEAVEAGDEHAASDLELLAATRATKSGDLTAALACAHRARAHALAAVAPLSYVAAATSLSRIAQALGDRDTAYEALATGWVTTADVMGGDASRQIFEPLLRELRSAWGEEAFASVRQAHDERRRATRRGQGGSPG